MHIYTGKGFVEQASDFDLRSPKGAFIGWLLNNRSAQHMYDFANFIGVVYPVPPDELHATICYAPDARLDQTLFGDHPLPMPVELNHHNRPVTRILGKPGSRGALVTAYDSDQLYARHRYWQDQGLEHTFPGFLCHVTLSYDSSAQDPEVVKRLIRCPCSLPVVFDRERIAVPNPSY